MAQRVEFEFLGPGNPPRNIAITYVEMCVATTSDGPPQGIVTACNGSPPGCGNEHKPGQCYGAAASLREKFPGCIVYCPNA